MSCRPLVLVAALSSFLSAAETPPRPPPPAADDAERTIVVTADRRANELERTTATVEVVDSAELTERGHPAQVHEALRDLPGVQIQHLYGGVGSLTRVRIRGAQNSDTQVLVDGIPFNDPGDFNGSPDLAWLTPAGLERIELVKGAQSGLYGSRAAGGVVQLITARPTDAHHGSGHIDGGSFGTGSAAVGATGPIADGVGYAVGASGLTSEGFSVSTDPGANGDPRGHERDGFQRLGANARVEAGSAERLQGYVAGAGTVGEAEYDDFDPFTFLPAPDDDRSVEKLTAWRAAGGGTLRTHEDVVFGTALAITDYDREYPAAFRSFETGLRDTRELFGALRGTYEGVAHTALTLGVDGRRDDLVVEDGAGGSVLDEDDSLVGVWAQGIYAAPEGYDLSLVLRRDDHSEEGDATTFRLGGGYPILAGRVRLLGAIATGFRAPSLSELYDPFSGNPDLAAQESEHYEIGARAALTEEVALEATWFATDYQQKIGFQPTFPFTAVNQPGATVDGVEAAIAYETRPLDLRLHYTHTRSDDGTGQPLGDTPEHRAGASLTHRLYGERAWFRVAAERVGERTVAGSDLDPYFLASASAGVQITRALEVYARGENLTDAQYEVNPGFTTAERAAYVGLGARW